MSYPRTVHIDFGGPVFTIDVEGKAVTFEDHWRIGPQVLKKNGDPYARQPGPRDPFWEAYATWRVGRGSPA